MNYCKVIGLIILVAFSVSFGTAAVGQLAGSDRKADRGKGEYDGANWMGQIKNRSVRLSRLSIPGTHDSGTKGISPLVFGLRCQNTTITRQLTDGIRFFDIRLNDGNSFGKGVIDALSNPISAAKTGFSKESLFISHSLFSGGVTFGRVLKECEEFLSKHENEVILMSVKEEDCSGISPLFEEYLETYSELFLFTDTIPTLEQAQGKIVLFYRFNFIPSEKNRHRLARTGIRLGSLVDNNISYYKNRDGLFFYVEDFYRIHHTRDKITHVEATLNKAASAEVPPNAGRTDTKRDNPPSSNMDIFYITFTSIALNGMNTPYDYAWGGTLFKKKTDPAMNKWLKEYLLEGYGERRLGVILMDFYNHRKDNELVRLIVEQQIE